MLQLKINLIELNRETSLPPALLCSSPELYYTALMVIGCCYIRALHFGTSDECSNCTENSVCINNNRRSTTEGEKIRRRFSIMMMMLYFFSPLPWWWEEIGASQWDKNTLHYSSSLPSHYCCCCCVHIMLHASLPFLKNKIKEISRRDLPVCVCV